MVKEISLGFSSCPNDTFMFYGLVKSRVGSLPFGVREHIHDIEQLNTLVARGALDVSKVSMHALIYALDEYALLRTGAALGWGVGPLIVARKGATLDNLAHGVVGSPGRFTTAQLILELYTKSPMNTRFMRFDEIMPAVKSGEIDYGLIIHEGRFTYGNYDLTALLDLGEWWEKTTKLPLPLGGIVVKRTVADDVGKLVEEGIRQSVLFARDHTDQAWDYISGLAQEMEPDVIRRHIELYVNDESLGLSAEGLKAVETLLEKAGEVDHIPRSIKPLLAGA